MRRTGALIILLALTTAVLSGCARNAPQPGNSEAPKEGATAPAAKPNPSPDDPAIKPPTRGRK